MECVPLGTKLGRHELSNPGERDAEKGRGSLERPHLTGRIAHAHWPPYYLLLVSARLTYVPSGHAVLIIFFLLAQATTSQKGEARSCSPS